MPYKDYKKRQRLSAQWIKKNPKKRAVIAKRYWQSVTGREVKRRCVLKTVFWTPEGWDKAYTEQNGLCAVCGQPETATHKGKLLRLAADHDHLKRIPRGLLCSSCNLLLGKAKDNIRILEAAIVYLRKFGH